MEPRVAAQADNIPGAARNASRLTVEQLARAIALPRHTVYRLLERGLVPGAFKLDPSRTRSHYYIPRDAPQRFLAQGDRKET